MVFSRKQKKQLQKVIATRRASKGGELNPNLGVGLLHYPKKEIVKYFKKLPAYVRG